jgi:hypothetical protein
MTRSITSAQMSSVSALPWNPDVVAGMVGGFCFSVSWGCGEAAGRVSPDPGGRRDAEGCAMRGRVNLGGLFPAKSACAVVLLKSCDPIVSPAAAPGGPPSSNPPPAAAVRPTTRAVRFQSIEPPALWQPASNIAETGAIIDQIRMLVPPGGTERFRQNHTMACEARQLGT